MNKRIFAVCMVLSILLTGCTLAQPAPAEAGDKARLMGVFLVDVENDRLLQNHPGWVESGKAIPLDTEFGTLQLPEEILPVQISTDTTEFRIPGVTGYALVAADVPEGDGICHMVLGDLLDGTYAVNETDAGTSFENSGTLYFGESRSNEIWRAYQVYQSEPGWVYLNGHGNSYTGGEFSFTLEETTEIRTDDATESLKGTIKVSLKLVPDIHTLRVLQYDEEGNRISLRELPAAEEMPDIFWEQDAAWAVVEERGTGETCRTSYTRPASGEKPLTHEFYILDENDVGRKAVIRFAEP